MPKQVPIETLQRLVIAGSQAELSFEYMISLLRGGFSPEQVLRLVESEWLDPIEEAEEMPHRIM